MALTDKLTAIGNAIREKTGKTDLIPLSDMPNEILNISGGSSEENPLYYAASLAIFGGAVFPENYEVVLKVQKAYSGLKCEYMFNNCHYLKTAKLISEDKTEIISFRSSFAKANDGANQSTLELIDLTDFNRKFSSLQIAFQYQTKLKSILGALDLSSCTNVTNWLNQCSSLEDIEFVPDTIKISISFQWCSKLTKISLISAINGLDNSVTGQTVTFSKTAVNNAFGIDVNDETTYTDEFITLINSKNNWEISFQ